MASRPVFHGTRACHRRFGRCLFADRTRVSCNGSVQEPYAHALRPGPFPQPKGAEQGMSTESPTARIPDSPVSRKCGKSPELLPGWYDRQHLMRGIPPADERAVRIDGNIFLTID